MKIIFSMIVIAIYLYSSETVNKDLIVKHCEDEASVYKDSKRLYNHTYNSCYEKAKNNTSEHLKKKMQELKISNEKKEKRKTIKKNKEPVGTWSVNWGFKYKQTYFYIGRTLFSKILYSDGSGSTKKVKYQKMENGTIKIPDIDPYGAYYLITSEKKLEFWSSEGKFYTAKRFKKYKNTKQIKSLYVGQKVPFSKWDEYGYPETLEGTNNKFWIVYLPKINVTFKSKKTTDIILFIKKGRFPNL